MQAIRRATFVKKRGDVFSLISANHALRNIEIIGFYFGAKWCIACRKFVPVLKDFYENIRQRRESFEVVYVSGDRSDEEMKSYMLAKHGDWLAVNVERQDMLGEQLRNWFEVEGIPTLVIIRQNGYVITTEGKMDILARQLDAYYSWLDGSGITLSPQTLSLLSMQEKSERNKCINCLFCCCRSS